MNRKRKRLNEIKGETDGKKDKTKKKETMNVKMKDENESIKRN